MFRRVIYQFTACRSTPHKFFQRWPKNGRHSKGHSDFSKCPLVFLHAKRKVAHTPNMGVCWAVANIKIKGVLKMGDLTFIERLRAENEELKAKMEAEKAKYNTAVTRKACGIVGAVCFVLGFLAKAMVFKWSL